MSLKTWRQEFYPVPASRAKKRSWEWAVRHSLRKWEGLLPKNLRKHGVIRSAFYVYEKGKNPDSGLCLSASTCSLCMKVTSYSDVNVVRCDLCPLYEIRAECNGYNSPWTKATIGEKTGRPSVRPLIRSLKVALKFVQTHRFNERLLLWEERDG